MKIFNAVQIKQIEDYTMQQEVITSEKLMERAGQAVANRILQYSDRLHHFERKLHEAKYIYVFCGVGNNGGDGFVIARKLFEAGYAIRCVLVKFNDKISVDCLTNYNKFKKLKAETIEITNSNFQEKLNQFRLYEDSIIIDAIFGIGLTRAVSGFTKNVIQKINASNAFVISIDLPSGLQPDNNLKTDFDAVVQADLTLTFQTPKLSLFQPNCGNYVGNWEIIEIGLNTEKMASLPVKNFYVDQYFAPNLLNKRPKFGHKGTFGHALIVGGSLGKMGAVTLATKAALRAGCGLVTAHIPNIGLQILQTSVPEAMVTLNEGEHHLSSTLNRFDYSAIGFGIGAGIAHETAQVLKSLIQNYKGTLVIDADGLNILSENKTWQKYLKAGTILTPHPKEFERLAGSWKSDEEKMEMLRDYAIQHQVVCLLKGMHSIVATPSGNLYFNSTGNNGMATAGTGDVLLGIITSLCAQGYESSKAAVIGAYYHGLAGNSAAKHFGVSALNSTDLLNYLKIE